MRVVSAIFRIVVGAIFGAACFVALAPAAAALLPSEQGSGLLLMLILIGAVGGLFSKGIRRCFGWGFLWLGLCVFALPLSTMILSGRKALQVGAAGDPNYAGARMVGAGLAGGILTGAAAIVGFFLGAIFLIIALVLLLTGRKEVILVDRASGVAVRGTGFDSDQLPAPAVGSSRRIEPKA
jgi:hypothetical protein